VRPPKLGDGALALLDVELGLALELGGKVRDELLVKLAAADRRLVEMAKHLQQVPTAGWTSGVSRVLREGRRRAWSRTR